MEAAGLLLFDRPARRPQAPTEIVMAKGQMRSNREIKKPKKKKEAVANPATLLKGVAISTGVAKKKP
jgi:hypothetical protein